MEAHAGNHRARGIITVTDRGLVATAEYRLFNPPSLLIIRIPCAALVRARPCSSVLVLFIVRAYTVGSRQLIQFTGSETCK
jgi:hypothetical protein